MRTQLTKTIAATFAAVGLVTAAGARWQAPAPAPAQAPAAAPAPKTAPATPPAATTTAPAAATTAAFQPTTPAEKAVAVQVGEFVKAYEAGDAQALAALYADDAVIVDPDGLEIKGKEQIARLYAESFAVAAGLKLDAQIEALRFLTPDVARIEGRSRLATPAGDAADYTRYSGLLVQKGGKWTIAEIREYPAAAEDVEPYERLKDLEWMVGEWVNEGQHDKVTAEIKWADNRSYLVRTYAAELDGQKKSSGTMFIGWDPQSGQIKSWLFDSEGGHGEGVWTRTEENQWVVKAQGVLRNGLPTSATQVHTILNKDSVKTDAVDRILGGLVAEDVLDVVMVRKAPAPAPAADATRAK
ncbi:SgcJ/EcaC family oxidoreductase [Paludisphaera mucosa]|uniref:SgcJ/EcaC family oxidoreductase n=1 Tax=Paludisphaera mucosa TaxID=3030827 RepID=A0ABT6FAN4_9BACT|nr:SgcJ/EcaC family oxidoreductase [Paludisphaera mucosa]MDG3004644.1 SgcJ/EcaC family oxidoreductase [Paludisphaera mucosa]